MTGRTDQGVEKGRLTELGSSWKLWATLAAGALLASLVSLTVGYVDIPLGQILAVVLGKGPDNIAIIVQEIRLPRTILGLLVGASLGISGAAMQGFLRNPLAEPGLMGVSGGAALGAVLVLYTGVAAAIPIALPIGGLLGAFVAVSLVYLFAGKDSGIQTLILAGVAINSIAAAGTSLALNLAPDPHSALEIAFWLMGSLSDRSFEHVMLATPFMVLGWILLLGARRGLNALSLGEETASSMGFGMQAMRRLVLVGTALAVGASVAVTGSIAFIGLVIPHLLRPFVGGQPGRLLPASALGGAVLVLLADIGVRAMRTGPELKLGVLTALVGAPFFLVLVLKMRRSMT